MHCQTSISLCVLMILPTVQDSYHGIMILGIRAPRGGRTQTAEHRPTQGADCSLAALPRQQL